MKSKWLLKAGKMLAIAIIAVFVIGCVVMLLWNALVPELFKGPVITYWQAIGLLVLSHILFHGFGGRMHGGWSHRHWRNRFEAKLAAMTPEEREKFKKDEYYQHCCRKDPDKEK